MTTNHCSACKREASLDHTYCVCGNLLRPDDIEDAPTPPATTLAEVEAAQAAVDAMRIPLTLQIPPALYKRLADLNEVLTIHEHGTTTIEDLALQMVSTHIYVVESNTWSRYDRPKVSPK